MMVSTSKQAADLRIGGRFHQPQGWPFSAKERVWMFDNEIDWVTRLECCESAVRRAKRRKIRERIHTRPSTSNESAMIQASVQVRRVSLGVAAERM